MGLFQTINGEAGKRGLPFLVVGGLAVNFHGISRDTADLDLLVQRDAREKWLSLLAELGYSVFQEEGAFVQLSSPKQGEWPVDLMRVGEPTFRAMFEHGREVEVYGARLLIPALEHLIALNLHALKNSHAGTVVKDFLDIENLVRVNNIDLHSETVRGLFLKYGNAELHEKISRACGGQEA